VNIFDVDIKKLYGVGAARASHYASLGVYSVGDLLLHYPRGYEDRGNIKLLDQTDGQTKYAYMLTVATVPKSVRVKGRMTLTKFRVYDDSASCEITFFNQDYLKNVFTLGATFRFYGKVEKKAGRYTMTSPAYEPYVEDKELLPLVPVYPLTEGITQKQISKDVSAAMTLAATIGEADTLPEEIRKRNRLCTYSYALRNIHMPESFSALAAAKKRLIFDEFFSFALGISMAGAKSRRAPAYACTRSDLRPLESVLPYSLTGAQSRVIGEIKSDMSRHVAMSRMVIGDVGSGKTVCAAAAMLFAVQNGRQAVLMAPTEILARQHYESLSAIFDKLGIRCALLIGATGAAEKRRIYSSLTADADERLDIVIGTHALLSSGVEFAAPGVVVVDEQHRFGVGQRTTLAKKNPMCHVLVMSATPIPRSLALALYGDLDISALDEIPPGRQKVDTFVVDESYRERLNGFIEKQVAAGGQVYVVCPAVEEQAVDEDEEANILLCDVGVEGDLLYDCEAPIKLKSAIKLSEELTERFSDLRVDFLHGKLKSREKEEKMAEFVSGETDILVSTTVIEVGVNVPNASLMIVENAERFGLSQLHQLRGRVGRGSRKSFCVLVSDTISKEGKAKERLMTMKNSHDGYEIAEKDLAMRGPGDFLRSSGDGRVRQSGGVRFRLAELCDDTGLMKIAFEEAKSIISVDPELAGYPELRARVDSQFTLEANSVN
jgi:ATP-dependent DNA helicase RecG